MDPLWYYGYRIGPASTYFEILITITKLSSTSGRVVSQETLSLSPSSQTVTNAARTVQVTLQGDLLSYTSAPTFESKFLLIPFTAGQAKTYEGSSKYMLVDQTLFTLDGRECNKIGVSYSAFRNQNNACGTTAGTCLANQPHDLYTADQAARARGVKGQYFASNFGQLSVNQFSATAGALDPTVQYLAYIDQQLSNSIVTLQLAADSIQFITNRASGVITTWFAPKFEAMSGNGLIIVSVRSTGTLNADFSVSVTQCSFGVLPTQSNTMTISAGSSLNFSFSVASAIITSSSNQCVATLRDSQAVVIDTKLVYFNVSTLSENRGAQGGERQPTGSGTTVQYASSSDCSVKCPSFFSLLCFFTNACLTNLLYLIGAGLGAVVLTCCGLCNIDKIIGCCWRAMSHCRWSDDEHTPHELIRPNRKRNRKRHLKQIDVNNKLDIDKIPIVTYEQAREMLSPGKPTAKQQQHDRDRLLTRDHDGNYSIEMTEATESSLP
jgi:hypothetical protein